MGTINKGVFAMNLTSHRYARLALLGPLLVCPMTQAELITLDLPELTGTFVHGQAPIAANFVFNDILRLDSLKLTVIATGIPGTATGLGIVPAEAVASLDQTGGAEFFFDPILLGPYGSTPDTSVHEIGVGLPGTLACIGCPQTHTISGQIVIATNDVYPGIFDAPIVEISEAYLTLDAEFCNARNGDIGCDGFFGIAELNVVLGNWNMTVPPGDPLADNSDDGFVGLDDLNAVLGNWTSPGLPPGVGDACFPEDVTCGGEGFIGIAELNYVLSDWNQTSPPANPLADPSGDGFVGIDDLNWVLSRWNAGTPPAAPPPTANTVPEPATLALLGLLSLLPLRRHS
jgi:hypothetical protein